MKIQYFRLLFLLGITLISLFSKAQTQQDTMFALITHNTVEIDGQAKDACWESATWYTMNQVWLPFGEEMKDGDFEGRFKLAWDSAYLYLLVEVIDDSLSDDHADPLQNWWDDDCVEIFIDEDRSKGDHQNNNNAFAYHVSLFYDAIDMGANGGVNYKENLTIAMDTISENTYQWEFAIKQYDKTFSPTKAEDSRVYLTPNKIMGFSIAYCDNDETSSRENFIGNMIMNASNSNDNYKTANYFGTLQLKDPDYVDQTSAQQYELTNDIKCYPNPVQDELIIDLGRNSNAQIQCYDLSGKTILSKNEYPNKSALDVSELKQGVYFLSIQTNTKSSVQRLIKK